MRILDIVLKKPTLKILLTATFLLCVFPLFARDVEITVEDTELSLPLEGAVIRSWDGKEFVCDAEGKALISVPDGRPVVIQGAYPGYESGRLIVAVGSEKFTLGLRLLGIMESRELVIEASRPGNSETKTGRSVGVTEREIAQTAEIGIIEDVMTSIKLLPGVGYAGMFNALPSIRGGDPYDMRAYLDGYYIDNPYHWGGGFSIFDPRMVQSAQLSHGVFSARHGHTISGLLEVSAKKPSSTETEFELGINTSAANFNLSVPLFRKGGIMFMGRVTYYDPVIWLAKQMIPLIPELEVINAVRVAPYIRNGTITADYRFYDNLELQATGFWGMDGVGASYKNGPTTEDGLTSKSDIVFDYTNYQGFITTALSWNPRNDMLFKTALGTGYHQQKIGGNIENYVRKYFSTTTWMGQDLSSILSGFKNPYEFDTETLIESDTTNFNVQGRADYDWELGKGFLVAAGVQEMFSIYSTYSDFHLRVETLFSDLSGQDQFKVRAQLDPLSPLGFFPDTFYQALLVNYPTGYTSGVKNKLFTTSGYTLVEYNSSDKRFGAELGLRLDHFYLLGEGFSISTTPVLNPRLNTDFVLFKGKGIFQSMTLSAGTGLFSSINNLVTMAEERFNLTGGKPNRSWTSVLGTNIEFPDGISLNIEGYYKYIFDRAYIPVELQIGDIQPKPYLDGEGRVWGIDAMLQKLQSRYWDGWISYSFSWARYRDPHAGDGGLGASGGNRGDAWYFPSYHRFHNLNLVLNIKPVPRINIYTRFGFASGTQLAKIAGPIISYPVYVMEENIFIEKFRRASVRDENNRTTPSLPLDIKFSILSDNEKGKTHYELYVAVENVLALLYNAQGNTSFNSYTGKEDTGSNSASYEIPIPIPSFGFRISY
ncbi:hypothetical protein AGMMS50293_23140 [Spirochaetia bacterium]|nr:hypothetical protein AGMMS50293_23140 [Spirochaetia bacterium]